MFYTKSQSEGGRVIIIFMKTNDQPSNNTVKLISNGINFDPELYYTAGMSHRVFFYPFRYLLIDN